MSDLTAEPPATTVPPGTRRHPRFLEPASLVLIAPLCIIGAFIGMRLIVTLGITANTSLIGALAAMVLARIPLAAFARYRSIHMQNLAQSAISAATFGAGNALMLPIGIPFVLGRPDLVPALFAGVFLAMLIDGYMLYRMFDSRGVSGDRCLAARRGGGGSDPRRRRGRQEGGDTGRRRAGRHRRQLADRPGAMSAFGVAFIGNIWALTMFGVGLLLRGYSALLFNHPLFAALIPGGDINKAYVPHGMMVGAGIVALIQVGIIILRRGGTHAGATRTPAEVRRSLGLGIGAYVIIAMVIALLGGLVAQLSVGMLALFADLCGVRRPGA